MAPGGPTHDLDSLNREIARKQFLPGWNRRSHPPMWAEPAGEFESALWRYRDAVDALQRSAGVVPAAMTERRNLILVNPRKGNDYPTVRTHVLAYQMVIPGDVARTHRHSPHAGRVILQSSGAYTIVDGVRIDMRPGDVVLTPSMHWHGHGHEGDDPAIWVDFLDVPLVHLLEPMFFEPYPGDWQGWDRATRDTPLLYPFDESLEALKKAEPDVEGIYGRRIELGSPALPTVGLYVQQLSENERTTPYRTTANFEYVVVEGRGNARIGETQVPWERGDVFIVPAWTHQSITALEPSILVAITDEPLQRYCGYLRVEKADGPRPSPIETASSSYRAG